MDYINNGRPANIIFIANQPVMVDYPSHYTPPTNGIIITQQVAPFYPNMIAPTISYLTKSRVANYLKIYGVG